MIETVVDFGILFGASFTESFPHMPLGPQPAVLFGLGGAALLGECGTRASFCLVLTPLSFCASLSPLPVPCLLLATMACSAAVESFPSGTMSPNKL